MNNQRLEDIKKTIELYYLISKCNRTGHFFSEYSRFYKYTNEDLANIYGQMDFKNCQKALCPTASGDHALNLAYFGVKEIDTFDCNRITEYYAKFKEMAILCLSYEWFQKMMLNTSASKNHDIEKEVIKSLPEIYRKYWEKVMEAIDDSKKVHKGIFELSRLDGEGTRSDNNIYQRSKNDYERLQKNLRNTKITYTNCDIKEIPKLFDRKDFITFSNILDYRDNIFHCDYDCAEFIRKVYNEILNECGNLMYFYNYYDDPKKLFEFKEFMMYLDFGIKKNYGSCKGEALSLKKY